MKLEVNKTHKKAEFNKKINLTKKFYIPFFSAVISVSLFSGCYNNVLDNIIEITGEENLISDVIDDNINSIYNSEDNIVDLAPLSVYDYANEHNIPINHILLASSYLGIELPKNDYKLNITDKNILENALNYSINLDEFANEHNISSEKLLQFCKAYDIDVNDNSDKLNGIQTAVICYQNNYSIRLDEFASKHNLSIDDLLQLCQELNIDGYINESDEINGLDTSILSSKIFEKYEQLNNNNNIYSGKGR